jgi:iron(III) transport system ATP-binding protein
MSMLEVRGLSKSFNSRVAKRSARPKNTTTPQPGSQGDIPKAPPVLNDVNFDVQAGEVFTLLGPSGCGKSTTLRSIAGLETPDRGSIAINGRTVYSSAEKIRLAPNARRLSMVFQSYAIWPHLNVFKNVAFPLEVRKNKLSRTQVQERVEAALEAVHLGGFSGRSAVKLSGGQQQRLALARSLVTEPELILLDEPLSNLDAKLRESMRIELKRLQHSLGLTSVYVTHDQGEALALSSRIAVMNAGKIVQIGRPREIYEKPNSKFVAEFVGTSNVVRGTIRRIEGEVAWIETPLGNIASQNWRDLVTGDEVLLMIRPEDIRLINADAAGPAENGWSGRALAGAYLGEAIDYVIVVNGTELKVRANDPSEHGRVGTDIFASIDPRRVHVLPPERALK